MPQRTIRSSLIFFAVPLISATVALGQSTVVPVKTTNHTWQIAQAASLSKKKLFVVTLDQPQRKQTCRIRTFTSDKLVCSHAIGGPRTYLPQQLVAIIFPGDGAFKIRFLLGSNIGLGASIWGTVVLAATCPGCAAATAFAALVFFAASGAVLIGDDQPNRLLYLASGQQLSPKLGFVESQ